MFRFVPIDKWWSVSNAILPFKWRSLLHIIHQIKIAHFIFVSRPTEQFINKSVINKESAYADPTLVSVSRLLIIVHLAASLSPYVMGSFVNVG